jgi:hypothetical protein
VAKIGAGDIRGAFDLLGTRLIESSDPVKAAADAWLKLDPDSRKATEIFTSGHRLRDGVLEALRAGQGTDRPSITLSVYENLNKTKEEMRHSKSYAPGMQLDVYKYYPTLGLEKGSYQIIAVDHGKRHVTLERGGEQHSFRPDQIHLHATGLALSVPKEITLQEGERVMATAPMAKRGVANGDSFLLQAIEGDRLRLLDNDGKEHLIEHGDQLRQRLDHADALNMHRAQGKTSDNAIALLSANDRLLNSQSLTYVLASRARDGFTLFLDDKEKVIQKIERNDGKHVDAFDLAAERSEGRTETTKAELPPIGLSDEMRKHIQSPIREPDRTNRLPVPEKKLGLDLM